MPVDETRTIADLLAGGNPSHPALIGTAPERVLTYGDLRTQVARLSLELRAHGLEPGSRVALVLANGPDFIVTFLGVTCARLTAAPINPAQVVELAALGYDAGIRAVIGTVDDRTTQDIAGRLGVPFWPVSVDTGGQVRLGLPSRGRVADSAPQVSDVALFLHTSGTTSKPKGVPLTHSNLMYSIANIAEGYRLTPADCTLLVMPLFHVHGLVGATLSTLHAGGTVVAPPRFSASAFWPLARAHRATWYSAVPTIHRTLLLRAADGAPTQSGFRFIRSCSSALAPAMLAQMEERFQAPVLEAYGMTEACHQIASNPLPPALHKSGSVGVGGRVEIAIVDEQGSHQPRGTAGEVAVKGPNVTLGYDRNPAANAAAFVDGYLRTGDRGIIDTDGYLSLIGRIKELINRGGEKISPLEVDAVLLAHPAVADAATFGVADAKYGEEIWAAVVLKSSASAADLQTYCRDRLADFKVPKAVYIVTELPKTATGKVQRSALAAQFAAPNR